MTCKICEQEIEKITARLVTGDKIEVIAECDCGGTYFGYVECDDLIEM